MTTLVMVEKAGTACMAADTLTTYGSEKRLARYAGRPEKIAREKDTYLGFAGWSVHQNVLCSAFANGLELPEITNESELFEFGCELHEALRDDYFLNVHEHGRAPYESSQMTLLLMNRHGIFALDSWRCAERLRRFAAVGSGSEYALGAMLHAYELDLSAAEVAHAGVTAGIEFDVFSQGPVSLEQVELAKPARIAAA